MPVDDALDAFADADRVVVAARDVGSRAYGLAGPESDYDVGVVFRQPPAEYATLDGYEATVERDVDDVDLTAWNVERFAELLADSNPSAFELLNSPVRYRDHPAFAALAADVGDRFNPMALYHHYRSLARSNYRDVGAGDATVKQTLYVVRGGLYAQYVRDTHTFPPLDFETFLTEAHAHFSDETVARARDLAARKRAGDGGAPIEAPIPDEVLALPEDIDPEEHAREVPRDRIDAFVRAVFSTQQTQG